MSTEIAPRGPRTPSETAWQVVGAAVTAALLTAEGYRVGARYYARHRAEEHIRGLAHDGQLEDVTHDHYGALIDLTAASYLRHARDSKAPQIEGPVGSEEDVQDERAEEGGFWARRWDAARDMSQAVAATARRTAHAAAHQFHPAQLLNRSVASGLERGAAQQLQEQDRLLRALKRKAEAMGINLASEDADFYTRMMQYAGEDLAVALDGHMTSTFSTVDANE